MEEWKEYRLGDVAIIKGGKRLPKGIELISNPNTHPYIRISDMYVNKTMELTSSYRYVDNNTFNKIKNYIVNSGDIILAIVGNTIGLVAIIGKSLNNANLTENCVKIIANKEVSQEYIYYYLTSIYGQNKIKKSIVGAAQPKLPIKNIISITISAPSKELQERTTNILSSLDDKIELNRRINENLEQQAQALFKSWFVDFEPFKDGKFVDSELGMIPERFNIKYIGDIPHTIESGRRPKGGATDKGVPSIGAENIKGLGVYDYSKTKYIPKEFALTTNRGKINGYELLIYKDGGKPGYFIPNYTIFGDGFPFENMFINEHVFKLDLLNKEYNIFAYFYMQTPFIMNQLNSIGGKAAIPGINTKDVESLPIFSYENNKIKEFGNIVLPMIKRILKNCRENSRLAQLRDTLLLKLMSGELKLSEIETKLDE
ncbi:restriction modification system DNA specificity domain protein [Phocaeicola coprophilus CAG:333]|uniref:restriction endonuclease subunit S n=1 Tax=Phocaeicola coprophilus TaxID=387090 RepID=UPI00034000E3|nr:restriction endonuclease subunit S [Phocaeicola coprophilus]CDC54831.1 restriction modification system DNA specificity domain protein [Phocaeicola coprophilus CAG:333]